VADGRLAGELPQPVLGEDLADVSHLAHPAELLAVARNDARRLLSPVLQGVQPQVGELRRLRVAEDSNNAAHRRAKRITLFARFTPYPVKRGGTRTRGRRRWRASGMGGSGASGCP